MGIILELEALFADLQLILPMIDAIPLSPELSAIRSKIEAAIAALKAAGL
jgi:hypothetical protein